MKAKIEIFMLILWSIGMAFLIVYFSSFLNENIENNLSVDLTDFPEDPDNEKYTTLDANNIFSEDFKAELIEYEQKEIEKYLTDQESKTEENDSEENATESISSERTEIPDDLSSLLGSSIETEDATEYHFEAFNDLKEKNEKISEYVDAILNTIINN